jgi:hypothetical protein
MKLGSLIGIEVVAFLLIIAETYIFFNVIPALGPIPHNPLEYTLSGLLKILSIVALVVVWFLGMLELTRIYTRSKLSLSPRPSS